MTPNAPDNAELSGTAPSGQFAPRRRPRLLTRGAALVGAVSAAGATAFLVASLAAPTTGASASTKAATITAVKAAHKGSAENASQSHNALFQTKRAGGLGRLGGGGLLGRLGEAGLLSGKVLHGSVTVKDSSGSYTTYDFQIGTLPSAPSSSSFAVDSVDSFSQTYQLLSSTKVRASSQGLQQGDQVIVLGVVDGSNVDAKRVIDVTELKAGGGLSPRRAPTTVTTGATTGSSPTTSTPVWGQGGRHHHHYGTTTTSSTTTTTT